MSVEFKRVVKYGLSNFWRHRLLSATTLFITVISLLVFSGLLAVNQLAATTSAALQNKVNVSVFFPSSTSAETIESVKKELTGYEEVKSAVFISAEEALAEFRKKHANEPVVQKTLDAIKDNPLESSLVVTAKELDQYPIIIQKLERSRFQPVFKTINFEDNRRLIETLNNITRGIRNFGILLVSFFSLVSILVIFNTLRLTIFNRREEIEIMRLVGASNWYTRGPFVVEGFLFGVLGTLIASSILFPLMRFLLPQISAFFGVTFPPGSYFSFGYWKLGMMQLAFGIVLGVFSSLIATRRHLKI